MDAGNVSHVVLDDDNIDADPRLRTPIEQMHPNIRDAANIF